MVDSRDSGRKFRVVVLMRVELDLPDWVVDRRISVLAGMEEAARYEPGEGWRIKIGRCSGCGTCCGDCEMKVKEGPIYRCSLRAKIPYECVTSDGTDGGGSPECSIRWKGL